MRDELFDGAGEEQAGASYPIIVSTSVTNEPVHVGGEGFENPAFAGLKDFEVEFLRAKRRNPVARFLTSRNLEV